MKQVSEGMTHRERRRMRAVYAQHQAMSLLGWDEAYYTAYQFECGLQYLNIYAHDDAKVVAGLSVNRLFWNWWKLHWTMRDELFIQEAWNINRKGREWCYLKLHNPAALIANIKPDDRVINGIIGRKSLRKKPQKLKKSTENPGLCTKNSVINRLKPA